MKNLILCLIAIPCTLLASYAIGYVSARQQLKGGVARAINVLFIMFVCVFLFSIAYPNFLDKKNNYTDLHRRVSKIESILKDAGLY